MWPAMHDSTPEIRKRLDRQTVWKEGDPLPAPTGRIGDGVMPTDDQIGTLDRRPLNFWKPDPRLPTLKTGHTDEVMPGVREFDTGATRSSDAGRYDPEGFLSPIVIERFAEYMNRNRIQADGSTRASDNWQAGIPLDQYMKGAWRHFLHLWTRHRGYQVMDEKAAKDIEDDLCALLFNLSGYLHELLKDKRK